MIKLNLRDVALAARARYEAGTLSAQAPDPDCVYRTRQKGVTYACAIGAALNPADLRALKRANPQYGGRTFQTRVIGSLDGWDSDDEEGVQKLQEAHDSWAQGNTSALFRTTLDSILGPVEPKASDPDAQVRETEETEREAGDDSAND